MSAKRDHDKVIAEFVSAVEKLLIQLKKNRHRAIVDEHIEFSALQGSTLSVLGEIAKHTNQALAKLKKI